MKKYPHIHFVSVLWVDSCKTTKCKVNESLFKAKLPWDVDSPLPVGRAKRIKSLQPKTFEEDVRNSASKLLIKLNRVKFCLLHPYISCCLSVWFVSSSV